MRNTCTVEGCCNYTKGGISAYCEKHYDRIRRLGSTELPEKQERLIEFNGQKKTLPEWAEAAGITVTSLRWRINKGWPLDRALTEPSVPLNERSKTNWAEWGQRHEKVDEG